MALANKQLIKRKADSLFSLLLDKQKKFHLLHSFKHRYIDLITVESLQLRPKFKRITTKLEAMNVELDKWCPEKVLKGNDNNYLDDLVLAYGSISNGLDGLNPDNGLDGLGWTVIAPPLKTLLAHKELTCKKRDESHLERCKSNLYAIASIRAIALKGPKTELSTFKKNESQ
ncbi:unnamed protein product [Dovyalis caffra]|uniref:Uncharacterized protein n=1 Tax=Dovyalis caffra TaxID=77055 RepID=A0AAV1SAU6_9ROSI|nr:unnamed protein product [Dovyalis caffra]